MNPGELPRKISSIPNKITNKERQDIRNVIKNNKRQQKQERQQSNFVKQLNKNRPTFDINVFLKKFNKDSKQYSQQLVEIIMAGLALSNATGYANEELASTFKAEDLVIDEAEINRYSTRMLRLNILELMGKAHKLDKSIIDSIVNLQIAKDFGSVPINTRPITPISRPISQEPIHVKKIKKPSQKRTPLIPFKS